MSSWTPAIEICIECPNGQVSEQVGLQKIRSECNNGPFAQKADEQRHILNVSLDFTEVLCRREKERERERERESGVHFIGIGKRETGSWVNEQVL